MLVGCGARTGLIVPTVDGATDGDAATILPDGFPNFTVTGICSCGTCKTNPWCTDDNGNFCDLGGMPGNGGCQPNPNACPIGMHPAIAIPTRGIDGAAMTLYCEGAVSNDEQTCQPVDVFPFGGGPPPQSFPVADYCLLTGPGNLTYFSSDPRTGIGFHYSDCAPGANGDTTGQYSCNLANQPTGGQVGPQPQRPWLNPFVCPKSNVFGSVSLCVPSTTAADALTQGRTLIGSYCRMWSAAGIPGPADIPSWTCFAPDMVGYLRNNQCINVTPSTANCFAPTFQDPGVDPLGMQYTVDPSSSIVVVPLSGGHSIATIAIDGAAAAVPHGDAFLLTLLNLSFDSARSHGGPVQGGFANLDRVATATLNSSGSFATFDPATFEMQARAVVGGRVFDRILSADPAPNASIQPGGTIYLKAQFTSTEFNAVAEMNVVLQPIASRPTARITDLQPSATPECTSPSGAAVTFSGTAASSSATSLTEWFLPTPFGPRLATQTDVATLQVPLLGPSDPALTVRFSVSGDGLEAFDTAQVRVIDTTPPTIIHLEPAVPCDWADPSGGFAQCIDFKGDIQDVCSQPRVVVTHWQEFLDCDPSQLLRSFDANDCVSADPNYAADLSDRVTYVVDLHAEDSWGNATPSERYVFQVHDLDQPFCNPDGTGAYVADTSVCADVTFP